MWQSENDLIYWDCLGEAGQDPIAICTKPEELHVIGHRDHENVFSVCAIVQDHPNAVMAARGIQAYLDEGADEEIFIIDTAKITTGMEFEMLMRYELFDTMMAVSEPEEGMKEVICRRDHTPYNSIIQHVPDHMPEDMICAWHDADGAFDRNAFEEMLGARSEAPEAAY